MILLLWILTNATVLARQSNSISALPKSIHMGSSIELSVQTSCMWEKNPIGVIWTCPMQAGLSLKMITALIWKHRWAMLHSLCISPWKGQVVQASLELKPRALGTGLLLKVSPRQKELCKGCEASGTTRPLCIQHVYQKLCWAAGTTTTSRGIGGQGRATPPWLRSCGRKPGAKQELPHHNTAFGDKIPERRVLWIAICPTVRQLLP